MTQPAQNGKRRKPKFHVGQVVRIEYGQPDFRQEYGRIEKISEFGGELIYTVRITDRGNGDFLDEEYIAISLHPLTRKEKGD